MCLKVKPCQLKASYAQPGAGVAPLLAIYYKLCVLQIRCCKLGYVFSPNLNASKVALRELRIREGRGEGRP